MAASFLIFTNVRGQEPSPAAPPEFGVPSAADRAADEARRAKGERVFKRALPIVARFGREELDLERCQAPCKPVHPVGRARCDRPAAVVAVENNPRPDGAIAAMALCDLCAGTVLATQGADYAKMTPLTVAVQPAPSPAKKK